MNTANFQLLADTIRQHSDQFNLNHWFTPNRNNAITPPPSEQDLNICGTAACLCGWVNFIAKNTWDSSSGPLINWTDTDFAAKWLGITPHEAQFLFNPGASPGTYYRPFWTEAWDAGLLPSIQDKYIYDVSANDAANMLEAFANGTLTLGPTSDPNPSAPFPE